MDLTVGGWRSGRCTGGLVGASDTAARPASIGEETSRAASLSLAMAAVARVLWKRGRREDSARPATLGAAGEGLRGDLPFDLWSGGAVCQTGFDVREDVTRRRGEKAREMGVSDNLAFLRASGASGQVHDLSSDERNRPCEQSTTHVADRAASAAMRPSKPWKAKWRAAAQANLFGLVTRSKAANPPERAKPERPAKRRRVRPVGFPG